jgi:hypothetical protein
MPSPLAWRVNLVVSAVFFLMFHAVPSDAHPQSLSIGGAYVSCWIERPTLDEADEVARQWIRSHDWENEEREEAYAIDRSAYENEPSGLEYYEQALIDAEVFVFHTYPADDRGST